MTGLFGSIVGDSLMCLVAVFSAAMAAFLVWAAVHAGWLRRRQQSERERTRREFWGYE